MHTQDILKHWQNRDYETRIHKFLFPMANIFVFSAAYKILNLDFFSIMFDIFECKTLQAT